MTASVRGVSAQAAAGEAAAGGALTAAPEPAAVRVLVVEDEPKTRASLAEGLALEGWSVTVAGDGHAALDALDRQTFTLVVLDWMLPGCDGLTVLRHLRAQARATAVLMLTVRDAVGDRVKGLEAGADDYLTKPFAFAELVARSRALLRRTKGSAGVRACADLVLDAGRRVATRAGRAIELTPREVDLLDYFLRYQGQVVTREMLEREVWKQTRRLTSLNNVIDVQVMRLRRKLEVPGTPRLLHTLRGLGYRFGPEPDGP